MHLSTVSWLFTDGEPSASELETYREVKKVLESAESILNELAIYKGAGREIREAITTPTDDAVAAAWIVVVPLVAKLKAFYLFSLDIRKFTNCVCIFCLGSFLDGFC